MIGAHLRGNAVAYVALFFALTGSAAALSRGEVKQRHIASGAVTTPKLAGNAVKPPKLATNAVRPRHIAAGAVGNAKIADGAVDADKVASQSIGAGQVANGAIGLDQVHRPSFLTREASGRQLRFFAYEVSTQGAGSWEFGRVTIRRVAVNQIEVCRNFFANWGYGISIDGSFQQVNPGLDDCGPGHTLTTGGQFQINAGQDLIFGSGDPSTTGYYFVYGFYSP